MEAAAGTTDTLYFFSGSGEMASLIREFNWNNTPLGSPEQWPQSLQTAVTIMLNNPFGMYIAWGNDFTQLYNDGYRPILGATKHPTALGISTRVTFEEIWPIIGPMFADVMEGKAIKNPDLMLQLNRNGFVEDCYFDFSYSPIRKEDGLVGGILVTVIETTNKKKAELALIENENRIRNLIEGLPLVVWAADTNGGLTYISQQWEEFYGNPIGESLGTGWAKFVHPDDIEQAARLWSQSLQNGNIYETEFRVLHKDASYRWILVRALPVYNAAREIVSWNGSNTDINDKKLSEQAARDSEERFRTMADNIPNFAWMANADGYIYWYNKQWYEYTGTTPEQMEGWGWQSVHHATELPLVLKKWSYSIDTGKPFEMVFPLKSAAGTYRRFLTRVLPVHDEAGNIKNWFGTNTDITEQLEAKQQLEESEVRFRTMAEGTEILIATSDESGNATYFNKAWIDLTGRSQEELLNFGWTDLIAPEDRPPFVDMYLAALAKQEMWTREFRILASTGEYRWLLAHGAVRLRADGAFAGFISSSVDITERKYAEQALVESEKNLRNIILQAPVAMCIFKGPTHIVELANERMFELWGKAPEQVMHKPMFEGLPEVKDQGFEELLDGVYKTGETFAAEGIPATMPRNGVIEKVYVNFVFEAYRQTGGEVTGILAVAIDVTAQVLARRQIEEVVAERTRELETANNDLKRSNAELAQYAYIASHDLQEPLRKISTYSRMLQDNLDATLNEKSKNYLNKINSASHRMTALIHDVLNYSQLEKEHALFKTVDLNEVIELIRTDYELMITQKKATITCGNLPCIEAIPLQMAQLFGNLIGNALKFSRKDVPPQISITASEVDADDAVKLALSAEVSYCRIEIKDNGIGFKEEHAEQIFHIFQRLHNKQDYEGTGIGLALCKKIAINHKGELNAVGSSESGAVFNVILPLEQVKNARSKENSFTT